MTSQPTPATIETKSELHVKESLMTRVMKTRVDYLSTSRTLKMRIDAAPSEEFMSEFDKAVVQGDRTAKAAVEALLANIAMVISAAQGAAKEANLANPTDAMVIRALRGSAKALQEVKEYAKKDDRRDTMVECDFILRVIEDLLPRQMDSGMVTAALGAIINELVIPASQVMNGPNRGQIMRKLKERHEGEYDPAMANTLLESIAVAGQTRKEN